MTPEILIIMFLILLGVAGFYHSIKWDIESSKRRKLTEATKKLLEDTYSRGY